MRYSSALIALFASLVSANTGVPVPDEGFTIPANEGDGVYSVYINENGTAVHELIAPALSAKEKREIAARDPTVLSGVSRIEARQHEALTCGGYGLDRWSTDWAVEGLNRQCNPGAINGWRSFYAIEGSTVAYICNLAGDGWVCKRDEVSADFAHITRFCGSYRAGWKNKSWHANLAAQIGYEDKGARFCGRGTSG